MEDDFYNFVNDKWLIDNPIPNDKSIWSQFNVLNEKNLSKIKEIITLDNKTKILFDQGMTTRQSIEHVQILEMIESVNSIDNLLILMLELQIYFSLNIPIKLTVHSNMNNTKMNILFINTGGLGLPDRDYYFNESYENQRIEYKKFMKTYSKLFNLDLDIDKIYFLEEMIAEKTYNKTMYHNPKYTNNIRTYNEIVKDYSKFTFLDHFFTKYKKEKKEINITNPNYFKRINELLINELLPIWKQYLKWIFILNIYKYENIKIEEAYLTFYEEILEGKKTLEPLNERVISNIINNLGQIVESIYIEKYFNNDIIEGVDKMIKNIISTIKENILSYDWLENKKNAILKLDKMKIKIGYPNKKGLLDYSNLNLSLNNSYLKNNILCIKFYNDSMFNNLYTEKNEYKWHKYAFEVNAYYSPLNNEIVFPAGILQDPFFDLNASIEKNYGGLGYIIGHEIIHSFDSYGRLYDENGNLSYTLWTDKDNQKYYERVKILLDQLSKYKLNQKLVEGEAIADLGGLLFSLQTLKKQKTVDLKIFFKSFANIFASNIREEKRKQKLLLDYHPPHNIRVNNTLKNIDDFYTTFNITKGKMYLEKNARTRVW
jgi:predicted metalloendopeptidase